MFLFWTNFFTSLIITEEVLNLFLTLFSALEFHLEYLAKHLICSKNKNNYSLP